MNRGTTTLAWLCGGLLASGTALAANLTGDWHLSSSVNGNPVAIACTLVQKRHKLSGTCQPTGFEASTLNGTVDAKRAKWAYDVVFRGNPSHVNYEAELLADGTLKGTMYLAGSPQAFTATRK